MQVGIDVGATKIESVILEENGNEKHRSRISCPKDYTKIITTIRDIHRKLEQEFKQELPIGVCHPGVHSPQTGLVKNAPNITWLEKKPFQSERALADPRPRTMWPASHEARARRP